MKIVSWNIRHGGGSSARAMLIRRRLIEYNADILVIPEFQIGSSGIALCDALGHAGYKISYPPARPSANTVMIASRHQIVVVPAFDNCLLDRRHLWSIKTGGIQLVGVYMPVGVPKLPYWEALIIDAASIDAPDLFVGDFNTGTNRLDKDPRGEPFVGPEYMDRMTSAGFVDLWRVRHPEEREYTWFSARAKNGFRLDHAFGSALFHRALISCDYDHEPRLVGESDHSALVLQLGTFQHEPLAPIIGCIYAVADPGCPNLMKIGKDQKWPMRFRQAQAHTPRGMGELGRWNIRGDRAKLVSIERQALSLFPREQSCQGVNGFKFRRWQRHANASALCLGSPSHQRKFEACDPSTTGETTPSRRTRIFPAGSGLDRKTEQVA